MNLKFWQHSAATDEDDEDEPQAAPPHTALERRAARQAAQAVAAQKPRLAPPDWTQMSQPDSGEWFERALIKTMHNLGPILITILIGASVGYFMADFQTSLTLTSAIGYGGGFTIAFVELALAYKKRLASKAGDDEQALWLLIASLAFGAASIITQIVFLQSFLSNHLADASALDSIPLLGAFIGILGGSTFFVIVRASIYHGALYASAWLLSGSRPSLIRQIEWQERQLLHKHAQAQFLSTIQEVRPAIATPERPKDMLAMMQQMMQQLTEMQVQHQAAITADWRTATPPEVKAVSKESEAAPDGRDIFR